MRNLYDNNDLLFFGNWIKALEGGKYIELASNRTLVKQWEKESETEFDKIKKREKNILNLIGSLTLVLIVVGIIFKGFSYEIFFDSELLLLSVFIHLLWSIRAYYYFLKYYNLFADA